MSLGKTVTSCKDESMIEMADVNTEGITHARNDLTSHARC
jgi:hypothetical protein